MDQHPDTHVDISTREVTGRLVVRRVHPQLSIVERADQWVLISEDVVTEMTDPPGSSASLLEFGTPGHGLGRVAYRSQPTPATAPQGTMLYRRAER